MLQSNEEQEVYMRFWRRCQLLEKTDRRIKNDLRRRNQPAVVRKDEVLKGPNLVRSKEFIAVFLYLICKFPEADYQINEAILKRAISQAKYRNYVGEWEIWLKMKDYFGLPDLPSEEKLDRDPSILIALQEEREVGYEESTIFSPYYFIEFLLNYYLTVDELMGNFVEKAVRLGTLYTVETYKQRALREERRYVQKVQRHRGYRDHGSCLPESLRAIRKANQEANDTSPKKITIDSLVHVTTWGSDPPQRE